MLGDPRKPLTLRGANIFFGVALFLSTVGTFLALGGIATAQSICHNDNMVEYWTPAYAVFIEQSNVVKKWTCTWYQLAEWWALGCQLTFWLFILLAWARGYLERHAMQFFSHGAVATALSINSCWFLMDKGNYYTGYAYTLGAIAFSGFVMVSVFNGLLGVALAEMVFAKKAARRAARACMACRDVEAARSDGGSDAPSSDADLGKRGLGQ